MEKKVLNGEQIRKKQEKQFTIVYIVGLVLFILVMIALNNNFGYSEKLDINKGLLNTPSIISIDQNKEKGKTLDEMITSYESFIEEIEVFSLPNLDTDQFVRDGDTFKYVDSNYTYRANTTSLKLTRQGKDVYSVSIEEGVTKYELYSDFNYVLEYTSNFIFFKTGTTTYNISITNNNYYVNCNYEIGVFIVTSEVYDNEWNFVNLELKHKDDENIKYTGYFFDNIEGYTLNEDNYTIEGGNESIPSTKYLEDNQTYYYTVDTYVFNNLNEKDILIVNNSQEFPLK